MNRRRSPISRTPAVSVEPVRTAFVLPRFYVRSPVDSVPSVHDWGLFVGSVPVSEAGGDAPSRHARATAERKEIVIGGLASRRTRLDSWVSQRRCRSDQIDLSTLTIDLTCEDADMPTGPNGCFTRITDPWRRRMLRSCTRLPRETVAVLGCACEQRRDARRASRVVPGQSGRRCRPARRISGGRAWA